MDIASTLIEIRLNGIHLDVCHGWNAEEWQTFSHKWNGTIKSQIEMIRVLMDAMANSRFCLRNKLWFFVLRRIQVPNKD